MKSITIIALLTVLLGCNSKKEIMRMPGAYSMLSSSVFDGEKDTTYTTIKEFKIFTYNYLMYVNLSPNDSISRFGIGSYSADSGKVIESIIYAATDTVSSSNPATFILQIEKTYKGYKQVIPDMVSRGKKYRLTEDYEAVSTNAKTPLDGAWKLVKAYRITGADTTAENVTRFKTFFAGHFVVGQTYPDSNKRLHTEIAYGKYELTGSDLLKEMTETNTCYQIDKKEIERNIELIGNGRCKQTRIYKDGSKEVEEYQLLKP
jgi:hypothetical protein